MHTYKFVVVNNNHTKFPIQYFSCLAQSEDQARSFFPTKPLVFCAVIRQRVAA